MNHPRSPWLVALGALLVLAGLVVPLVLPFLIDDVGPSPPLILVMFAFPPPALIIGCFVLARFLPGYARRTTERPPSQRTYGTSPTLRDVGALLTLCGPAGIAFVVYVWRELTSSSDNVGALLLSGFVLLMIASMSGSCFGVGVVLFWANSRADACRSAP